MGAKTDPALVAVMRQEFMAGESLRDLAQKHGLNLRTLARLAKAGDWNCQRGRQRLSTALPKLEKAADARVESIVTDWRGRLESIACQCTSVAGRASDLLNRADLDQADFRDLASLLKIMIDGLSKLREVLPARNDLPQTVLGMTHDQAVELLRRRGNILLPADRLRMLQAPVEIEAEPAE